MRSASASPVFRLAPFEPVRGIGSRQPGLPQVVQLTLFCAGDECVRGRTPTLGWKPLSGAGLALRVVSGDHYTIIQPPEVALLGQRLRAGLAQAAGSLLPV